MARPTGPARFYAATLPHPRGGEPRCALDAEQTRHARKVLRLRKGDEVELFDGAGHLARATLSGYAGGVAWAEISSVEQIPRPEPAVRLAAAMPKGSAGDTLVNGLSQLGVDQFTPIQTEHGVVDPRQTKLERLSKLAMESAKQCGRAHLMTIDPPLPMGELIREPTDLGLVLTAGAGSFPAKQLTDRVDGLQRLTLLIGPEGGFTERELRQADNHDFIPWALNSHTLRIETAALAAAAIVGWLTMANCGQ